MYCFGSDSYPGLLVEIDTDSANQIGKGPELIPEQRLLFRREVYSVILAKYSLTRLRLAIFGGAGVLAICLLLVFVPLQVFHASWGSPNYYGTIGLFTFISLTVVIVGEVRLFALKHLEQNRLRAALGNLELLADVQPHPDVSALELPFTLSLHYPLPHSLKQAIRFVLLALFFIVSFLMPVSSGFSRVRAYFVPLLVFGVFLCLFYSGFLVVQCLRRNSGYQLTITQDGIHASQKSYIAWRDARLFAIVSPTQAEAALSFPLIMVVASANTLIRIMWLRPDSSRSSLLQPQTSYDVYERQMHRVMSVIVAKTDLPLYDLRKL
jgi:hypothetical protein